MTSTTIFSSGSGINNYDDDERNSGNKNNNNDGRDGDHLFHNVNVSGVSVSSRGFLVLLQSSEYCADYNDYNGDGVKDLNGRVIGLYSKSQLNELNLNQGVYYITNTANDKTERIIVIE